jgi:hypothetical protein
MNRRILEIWHDLRFIMITSYLAMMTAICRNSVSVATLQYYMAF